MQLVARSHLYRTAPVGGPPGQAEYVNAACRVRTMLSARALLEVCLDIEKQFGRTRNVRWEPRTLDIDLLLYGSDSLDEPGLHVPHASMRDRLFVLVPLADVMPPDWVMPPDGATLSSVLNSTLSRAGQSIEAWRSRVVDTTEQST
jgi:2-amino-4-hydroxy-6-hydroxymethyldihydropteridine diphosphokinase